MKSLEDKIKSNINIFGESRKIEIRFVDTEKNPNAKSKIYPFPYPYYYMNKYVHKLHK